MRNTSNTQIKFHPKTIKTIEWPVNNVCTLADANISQSNVDKETKFLFKSFNSWKFPK